MTSQLGLADYSIDTTIGSGSSCKVKLANRLTTGERVAIKIIQKSEKLEHPGPNAKIQSEISLLCILDHPHIIRLLDSFEDNANFYIVTEYASRGDLFDLLRSRRVLPPQLAIHFFRHLIYGVEYLHQRSICHRDLKPENLFIDGDDNLKIGDFGCACRVKEGIVKTACGSLPYLAPEVFHGEPYDARKSDIWTCGVILFALLAGRLPFVGSCERVLAAKIKAGRLQIPSFPAEVRDLVARILTTNVQKRYTITEIKNHPVFRMGLPKDYKLPELLPVREGESDEWNLEKAVADLNVCRKAIADKGKKVRVIEEVKHGREFVIRTVQQCVGGAGFEWFHPDDSEVICRRQSDGLEIKTVIGGRDESVRVDVRLKRGEEETFEGIANRIMLAVQRMPVDQL